MANEAFALSPISARATFPGEEDYAAISEAFMETARGRWFLAEYARRNRNADTRMVLDAVARIEQGLAARKDESLAAQREATATAAAIAAAETSRNEAKLAEARLAETRLVEAGLAEARLAEARLAEARLAEAMVAIRHAVEAAQVSAVEAVDGLALSERLAPVRKGARVLREIAWRLREIGNDGRICDLIDSQVSLIEKGAEQITSEDTKNEVRTALGVAFAAIEGRLTEFGGGATQAPVTDAQVVSSTPTSPQAPAAIEPEHEQEAPQASAGPISTGSISTDTVTPAAEAPVTAADTRPEEMESADSVELSTEADDHDEALLDMIAMEMGAPDPIDDNEIFEPVAEAHIAALPPVEPEIVAELPEPMAAPAVRPVQRSPQPIVQTETRGEPAREISLGSSIIASGLVRRPVVAANDPLAPIRRMSQAEKIAFFS
jgi:hypothetical protein